DTEPVGVEAGVAGQRAAEVARPDDEHVAAAVEPEDGGQMPAEGRHTVPDATHAELPELSEVLPDLRGVQMELSRQLPRGDRADPGFLKQAQAAEVEGQSIRREAGDRACSHRTAGRREARLVTGFTSA